MCKASNNAPLVSIIILNYNGREHIEHCLNSVQKILYPNYEVIVVDNASTDGSAEIVGQKYPSVMLIKNPENIGFAAGNNVGISKAKGDFIFLLNQDTEIHPMCINRLVEVMEQDPEIGICGAKILLFDRRETIQHAGGRFHPIGISLDRGVFEIDRGQYDKVEEVTFVCGAAMLFRKELIPKIGFFDPCFFLYHEDVDFCIRAWLQGLRTVYVPTAIVYHKSGYVSELTQHRYRPNVTFHKNKNTLLILLKNFPIISILLWLPLSICYRVYWLIEYLVNGNGRSALAVIKSVLWVIFNINKCIQLRYGVRSMKQKYHVLKEHLPSLREVWITYKKVSQHSKSTRSR